jgi:hypothetical protein
MKGIIDSREAERVGLAGCPVLSCPVRVSFGAGASASAVLCILVPD